MLKLALMITRFSGLLLVGCFCLVFLGGTPQVANTVFPVPSPKTHVFYAASGSVYYFDLTNAELTELTFPREEHIWYVKWIDLSADGRVLTFGHMNRYPDLRTQIAFYDLATRKLIKTEHSRSLFWPSFSPANQLAVVSKSYDLAGKFRAYQLFLYSIDGQALFVTESIDDSLNTIVWRDEQPTFAHQGSLDFLVGEFRVTWDKDDRYLRISNGSDVTHHHWWVSDVYFPT